MSGYNNGLRYYKTYYNDIKWEQPENSDNKEILEARNGELFDSTFPRANLFNYSGRLTGITLQTTYPGLIIGSGIAHGTGLEGELKLGFFFDYTTGLPVIPGSSVKGVLRSAFPGGLRKAAGSKKERAQRKLLENKAKSTVEYLKFLLKQVSGSNWSGGDIDRLETFLFGSLEPGKAASPMSGRIIFHDAVPISARNVRLNEKNTNTYLGDDYITPHKNRKNNGLPDELVDPVPIAFLKVLPGVEFTFQFELHPFPAVEKGPSLSTDQIKDLFSRLLRELGVGAKTNVGYGRFQDETHQDNETEILEKEKQSSIRENDASPPKAPDPTTKPLRKWSTRDKDLIGQVDKVEGSTVSFTTDLISDFQGVLIYQAKKHTIKYFSPGKKFKLQLVKKKTDKQGRLPVQVTSFKPLT